MSRLFTYCCAILVVIVALLHSAEALTTDVRREVLDLHNKFRAIHHSPKLIYNAFLERYSQQVSDKCAMVRSDGPYGENMAGGSITVIDAINAWYNESKHYKYDKPGFTVATIHFTQMIWKHTTQVGCAITDCDQVSAGYKLVTCSYFNVGNTISSDHRYFKDNVLAP